MNEIPFCYIFSLISTKEVEAKYLFESIKGEKLSLWLLPDQRSYSLYGSLKPSSLTVFRLC